MLTHRRPPDRATPAVAVLLSALALVLAGGAARAQSPDLVTEAVDSTVARTLDASAMEAAQAAGAAPPAADDGSADGPDEAAGAGTAAGDTE